MTIHAVVSEYVMLCTDVEVQNFSCTAILVCLKELFCRFWCFNVVCGPAEDYCQQTHRKDKMDVNTAWTLSVDCKRRK